MPGRSGESTPVTSQEFVSLCRRYDRDQLLWLLYQASRTWDGETLLPNGQVKNVLPWTVAGVAAVLICRGTSGGRRPAYADVELICNRFMHLVQPGPLNGIDDLVRGLSRYISQQGPHQRAGLAAAGGSVRGDSLPRRLHAACHGRWVGGGSAGSVGRSIRFHRLLSLGRGVEWEQIPVPVGRANALRRR